MQRSDPLEFYITRALKLLLLYNMHARKKKEKKKGTRKKEKLTERKGERDGGVSCGEED